MRVVFLRDNGEVINELAKFDGMPDDLEIHDRHTKGETIATIAGEVMQILHDEVKAAVRVAGSPQ